MTAAARLGDAIAHTAALGGLLTGLLLGAAVAVAAVAIVGTGGLAAVALVGAGAAAGAGIGQVLGSLSCAPKPVTGTIIATGSFNVYINGKPAGRAHIDVVVCSQHPGPPAPIAEGSASVSINRLPAARVGDHTGCSAVISLGSHNVNIGGPTVQTDIMNPEVPGWLSWSIGIVGLAAAVVLFGPVVAVAAFIGSAGMGLFGNWLGGKIWGEGSDGQKLSMLAGSILGGAAAVRGGVWFERNYTVSVQGLGSNLGNVRIIPKELQQPDTTNIARDVNLSRNIHGEAAEHAADAINAGKPNVLTINRTGTHANRTQSIGKLDKIPGKHLDEYPPAMFKEGGAGASVRAINPRDNMSAGACIGNACRGLPDGTKIRITVGD